MKNKIVIVVLVIVAILAAIIAYVVFGSNDIKEVKIYRMGQFNFETNKYDYEEIKIDDKDLEKLEKYYSKIVKKNYDVKLEFIGTLKVVCEDGSGFYYDTGNEALYYDNIADRTGKKIIKIDDDFANLLEKYQK